MSLLCTAWHRILSHCTCKGALTGAEDHVAKRGLQILDGEGQHVADPEVCGPFALIPIPSAGNQLREIKLTLGHPCAGPVADVHPNKLRLRLDDLYKTPQNPSD